MVFCDTSLSASSFRIQDFSIATPLEQLAKDIFHCLHSVKHEWFETTTKEETIETKETIFIFKKDFSSSHKHYTLEFFQSLPLKKCHEHLTFFFGKKHFFQRCFSVNSGLILSFQKTSKSLNLHEAKMLLDALVLGCQEMKMSLPCFVLLDKNSSYYIGEYIKVSPQNSFQIIHFETIIEPYTFKQPSELSLEDHQLSVCDLHDRYEFFKKFCTLTFLFQRYPTLLQSKETSGFFFIQGFRYIYFLDQFTPLRNTFWISFLPTTESHDTAKSPSLPVILDPITQLHCICTWKPTKTAFDNLWTSLDPWNALECTWTLRVVGSQDRSQEELDCLLDVTTTFRKIITIFYDLQCATTDVKVYTQSQLDKTLNFFFFDQPAFLEQLVDYIFDTTTAKENPKNGLYTITNSFLFRLTHVIKQLSSSDMLIHLWNHVMTRIQYYWDNKLLIPNVYKETPYATKGHPKTYDPPLLQKLKVLNCCIQQYHVLASFQEKNKETLLCTVCTPFDFETSHTEYTSFRENRYRKNFLPLEALMEYFLLKHSSKSSTCENLYRSFYKWIKSFSKTFYLSTSTSFLPHCDPLLVKNQSSFFQCKSSEKTFIRNLWTDVWNESFNNTIVFKTPTLFEPLKLGEMALSFLKYLTPIEISLQILFCQLYVILKRWKKSSSVSERTRNYFYDWLNYIIFMLQYKKYKEHSDIWKTWNLKQSITLHLKHFKWFHAYPFNSLLPQCISYDACTTSIQKLQFFELHSLYEDSLKEKLPNLPTNLVNDLLVGIQHSTDTLILDEKLKKNCLTLFSVESNEMPGSISYSPLPLLPLNTEYIYGFGFENDINNLTLHQGISLEEKKDHCIQNASSFCFFSRLSNECRIALSQKII